MSDFLVNPLSSAELLHWRVKSSGVRQVKKIRRGTDRGALWLNGLISTKGTIL
jgi:hypothetical protein